MNSMTTETLPRSLTVAQLRHRASVLCGERGVGIMVDHTKNLGWFALAREGIVAQDKSQSGALRKLIAWLEKLPAQSGEKGDG